MQPFSNQVPVDAHASSASRPDTRV